MKPEEQNLSVLWEMKKGNIIERAEFPTTSPEETMNLVVDFFKDKNIEAMGIGCFGPISLNKKNADYGCITTTPKLLWQNYNIVKKIKDNFDIPVGFDTDVNAAALGRIYMGTGKRAELMSVYDCGNRNRCRTYC